MSPNCTEHPPADDEFGLTALTATSCSYASAYDPGQANGSKVCEDDVMAILKSHVLNAEWDAATTIGYDVKGTLGPGSIQFIVLRGVELTKVFSIKDLLRYGRL